MQILWSSTAFSGSFFDFFFYRKDWKKRMVIQKCDNIIDSFPAESDMFERACGGRNDWNLIHSQEMPMNYREIKDNSILSAEELRECNIPDLKGRAADFSAYTFWQYTSVGSIRLILDGDCFWVNNISNMNDLRESRLHDADKENIYVQCFCNSGTEKIPMWYLYGGITGKGASIGFTPAVMKEYIKSIQYVTELVKNAEGKYIPGEQFKIGEGFDLQVGWVFYANERGGNLDTSHAGTAPDEAADQDRKIRVNYRGKFVNVQNVDAFLKDNFFIKNYPWEYEKEFRLVFINKTGKKIEKIRIDIPEEFRVKKNRKLKIKMGPEISNSANPADYEKHTEPFRELDKKYNLLIQKSDLQINMDLLARNKDSINEYILENPYYLKEDVRKKIAGLYKKT